MTAAAVIQELAKHSSDTDAAFLQRFFKTGAGEYGQGDVFIGVRVPMTRKVCRDFKDLALAEIAKLLDSEVHEHRLAAVILLGNQYARADEQKRQAIFDLYLEKLAQGRVNNWDIVDTSAEHIVGAHLQNTDRKQLHELAQSNEIWQRRVAIISTFAYIKQGDPTTTLELAEALLHDSHDLIQKATGWMLREVGKRVDEQLLIGFLDKHAHEMPRTMLRYSLEKLPPQKRQHYMRLKG